MNKITIPALLLGVVMIAGAFAFMPVQEASTVHTTSATTLGADAITAAKIADASITADQIGADAIGASEIAASAIGAAEIATDAITAAEIAADAIGASEIAASAIGAAEIATDAIGAAEIAADAITAAEIAADAIGASELAATAVTEIQTLQIKSIADLDISTAVSCTSTVAFLVHYSIGDLANSEVVTIGGTATENDVTITGATASLPAQWGSTIGGAAGQTVTFASGANTADLVVTIVTAASATAACA
jgi:hypothetical protein